MALLPERPYQAAQMTICVGHEVDAEECGHWYSPAAVAKFIAAERHDCEIAVWLVRQEATKPDAPDEGVSGWLQEAEDRIRARSNDRVEGRDAASSRRVPSHDGLEGNGTGRHE